MWKPIEEVLPIVLVIIFITQIALPLAFSGAVFWLFRKTNTTPSTNLEIKVIDAKQKSDEAKVAVNEVKNEIDNNLNKLLETKKEVDNL